MNQLSLPHQYVDRPLSAPRIDRILFYTERVRQLALTGAPGTRRIQIDPSLVHDILRGLKNRPLFPRLKVLELAFAINDGNIVPPLLSGIYLFFSETLQTVKLSVSQPPNLLHIPSIAMFIHDLAERTLPRNFKSFQADFKLSADILGPLMHLKRVEVLQFPMTRANALDLTTIQSLLVDKSLIQVLYISHGPSTIIFPPKKQKKNYPAKATIDELRTLSLGSDTQIAPKFFSSFSFPQLQCLQIFFRCSDVGAWPSKQIWDDLFFQITESSSAICGLWLHLGENSISVGNGATQNATPPLLLWQSLKPLLQLQNLTKVKIQGPKVRCFMDDDFFDLVQAWPRLEELALETEGEPSITHASLLTIAIYLPKLKSLTVNNINLEHAHPSALPEEVIDSVLPDHPLTKIYISERQWPHNAPLAGPVNVPLVEHPFNLAQFLDMLFPSLCTLNLERIRFHPHVGRSDVWDFIVGLQAARKREKTKSGL
ncbi:hypothetical protein CVT24_000586 [Panaeolus cyanescens]|uniref:F-box domain-containing protein n=1 Tax=Panaeolus cyanescens TaxID=181874 RepID=A0A409YDF6_9AGAR|nr:hypothetical protein CVT24_000586 [Panaeolus cyanescens]